MHPVLVIATTTLKIPKNELESSLPSSLISFAAAAAAVTDDDATGCFRATAAISITASWAFQASVAASVATTTAAASGIFTLCVVIGAAAATTTYVAAAKEINCQNLHFSSTLKSELSEHSIIINQLYADVSKTNKQT
jgi:hypothetical protein